jgi:DNA-binding LytR/AlgR family response regulator
LCPVHRPPRTDVTVVGECTDGREAIADIDWVEASGNYVALQVGSKSWPLRHTFAAITRRLEPASFVRIHRCILLRIDRVRELRARLNGDYEVTLRDGQTLRLSRGYHHALARLMGE